MGWTISVGRAGAATQTKRSGALTAMSMRVDEPGVVLRLNVNGDAAGVSAASVPAWQAQRVWQKVLATVVGLD